MKIPALLVVFLILSYIPAIAGYDEDLNGGNAAYRAGDYKTAYGFYVRAYKEKPGRQLFDFLVLIRKKIYSGEDAGRQQNYISAMPDKKPGGPIAMNWWVIGADAGLAAFSAYELYDYNRSTGDYNSAYDTINDTTHANYLALMDMKSSAESKGSISGVSAVITGAALVYTACDALFFHMAFPVETSLAFDGQWLKTAVNKKF